MSLSSIRSIASSALTASQVQIQVTSANLANADTDGYTRKTASQVATTTGTTGSGTTITAVSSSVDKYLLRDIIESSSTLGYENTLASFTDSLQSLFGTVSSDGGTSLADTLADVETALISLASTPESSTLATTAMSSVSSLISQLRETSQNVQGLRADADAQIADSIDTINEAIETIDKLNDSISTANARGDSTADLEDERNQALETLSGMIDISYSVTSSGRMQVATSGGTLLVGSSANTLSYDAATYVSADTVFSGITVDGVDITSSLTGGTVGALISLRDEVLPEIQDELDSLASTLISTLNDAYNSGTSLPAPSSLTGSTSVDATDAFSGTGSVRIAIVDDDGNLTSYADFDLSSYSTVGDLVSAIDGTTGLSASITDGALTITSTSGSGVALADLDAEIGSDSKGFSSYFGLNDLLTGTGAADVSIDSDVTENGFASAKLSTETTLTAGDQVLSYSADFVQDLVSVFSDSQAFSAAGGLGATSATLADYAADIVGDVSTRASSAESSQATASSAYQTLADALSSDTGVNIDEETARLTELQQLYSASAQIFEAINEMFDVLLSAARS